MTAKPSSERPLTVLVVGVEDWGIEQAARALGAAGNKVLRCHEPEPAFPCNALLQGRTCPLVVGFDVALTARSLPAPVPAPGETRVVCALGRGIPLVVAGLGGDDSFGTYAAEVVPRHESLVRACEAASSGAGAAGGASGASGASTGHDLDTTPSDVLR